jgi:hypothetical protein
MEEDVGEQLRARTMSSGGARKDDGGELSARARSSGRDRRGSGGGRPAGAWQELEETSAREQINGRAPTLAPGHASRSQPKETDSVPYPFGWLTV